MKFLKSFSYKFSLNLFLIILCFVLVGKSYAADIKSDTPQNIMIEVDKEHSKQQKEIKDLYKKINQLVNAKKFEAAIKKFDIIKDKLSKFGNSQFKTYHKKKLKRKQNKFYEKWSKYLEQHATKAFLDKNWKESKEIAEKSLNKLSKEQKTNKSLRIQEKELKERSEQRIKEERFKEKTSLKSVAPQNQQTKFKKEIYYTRAEKYIKNEQYNKAQKLLEKILTEDPYAHKAMYMLKDIYKKMHKKGKLRKDNYYQKETADAIWSFSEPVEVKQDKGKTISKIRIAEPTNNKIRKKLNNIQLEKVKFEDTPLKSVINYLRKRSKQSKKYETGINFVLNFKNKQQLNQTLSMNMQNVPMIAIIKYIAISTGLDYKITENAVVLGDKKTLEKQITKYISIKSDLIHELGKQLEFSKKVEQEQGSDFFNPEEFGPGRSEPEESVNKFSSVKPQVLKKFFQARGIPLDQDSKIAWDQRTNNLVVTAKPKTIRIMKNLLEKIDIQMPLVLIKTKFVEINQTDLEEFGFDWDLNLKSLASNGLEWGVNRFSGDILANSNQEQVGNDPLVRHYGTSSGGSSMGRLINNLKFNFKGDNSADNAVNFTLYALDRSGIAEVLKAPKIITKSGSTASINMIKERYFPESWSEPNISTPSGGGGGLGGGGNVDREFSTPEFGEPTNLGIMMQVTPTVSPNKYNILLDLEPQIQKFAGWADFSYKMKLRTPSETQTFDVPLRMANTDIRQVTTKAKVYDGETIVLGGMIKNDFQKTDDRMPVLSEVPLVGRLFRSEFKKNIKKNLLIFVTTRLIKRNGKPYRKSEADGKPNLADY